MGSCISKCKPKKKFKEDPCRHVHDKLVISQHPPIISPVATNITKTPLHKPLSPAPSTSSTASFSSFSCSTNSKCTMASSISSSSSSLSSSSYSSTASKDRSFSNDYLWSCVKENPHVVGLREKTVVFPNKIHSQNLVSSPLVTKTKQITVQEKVMISTPKKRARASSPTLIRQKSFRKEQNFVSSTPNRGLRSPSPSRRFNGENNRIFPIKESSSYRKPVVSKGNAVSYGPKRESFRAPSPNRELTTISRDYAVRKNDAFSQHMSSSVGDGKEIDIVMEDINNPLIALDCFIFL